MPTPKHAAPDVDEQNHAGGDGGMKGSYLRFIATVVTAMVIMYGVMYLNTLELDHVWWSEERAFMTMLMGGTMAVVMLGFMWGVHRNWKANVAILAGAAVVFGLGLFLVRSETTVQDRSYMSAMIPHHSIAILTSERSEIRDVRVCRLVGIIEAQRREIAEMDWLIEDIGANGLAETVQEAGARPVGGSRARQRAPVARPSCHERAGRVCTPAHAGGLDLVVGKRLTVTEAA